MNSAHHPGAVLAARLLLLGASGIAAYLAYTSMTHGSVVGCGGGGSCSDVLQSKWSSVLGVPVSLPGLVAYLFLIVMASRIVRGADDGVSKLARLVMWMIPLGAAWFVYVQAVLLKAFCPYCCTAHALAVLAVTILWRSQLSFGRTNGRASAWRLLAPGLATASVAAMAVTQSVSSEPKTYASSQVEAAAVQTSATGPTSLSFYEGEHKFALDEYPIAGSAKAPHVLVAITDYACAHCRHLHEDLLKVLEQQPKDALAVMWLPGSRNDNSAEIHRMMLSLWMQNREAHGEIEKAIFDGKLEAKPEPVKAAIVEKLTQAGYDAMMTAHAEAAHQLVYRTFKLFEKNGEMSGKKMLPMLMAGSQVLVGAIKNPLIYHQVIEKEFALKVPADVQAEAIAAAEKSKAEAALPATKIAVLEGKHELALDEFPITGNTHAANAMIVVSDLYNCGPCRKLHESLPGIMADYAPKDVAVLWLPGMIAEDSGEIYKMMLALWKENTAYHDSLNEKLMSGGAVTSTSVKKKITEMLGGAAAFDAMQVKHGEWANAQMKRSMAVYRDAVAKAGKPVLPMIIAGEQVMTGAVESAVVYQQVFEKQFGVKKAVAEENRTHKTYATYSSNESGKSKTDAASAKSASGSPAPLNTAATEVPGYSHKGTVLKYYAEHEIDTATLPALGKPSAKEPLVLLMDFLSPSARAMAADLLASKRAVTLLPAMPTGDAQSAHRVMLTLWKDKPEVWMAVVEKLLAKDAVPTPGSIADDVTKAIGGDEELAKAMEHHKAWLQQTLVTTHRIYLANNRLLGGPQVPQLMAGARIFTGSMPAMTELDAPVAQPTAALSSAK